MEGEDMLENLIVPDSYQSDEECDLHSKSPSLLRFLLTRNNGSDNDDVIMKNANAEEPRTTSYEEEDNNENKVEEQPEEIALEEENEFYMVWFDAFLAKHGFDKDCLDQSSLQQICKTWLQRKLTSAQFRSKEAEIDLNFINFRYAICKQWLSSL